MLLLKPWNQLFLSSQVLRPLLAATCYLLLVDCLSTKSSCRQQNAMPLMDESAPELHRKMPNISAETVERTIIFRGFAATAGCYCHLLPATCGPRQKQKHLRQQNAMPLKDEPAPELRRKMSNVTSETVEKTKTIVVFYCWLLCYCYFWTASEPKAPADSKTPCH